MFEQVPGDRLEKAAEHEGIELPLHVARRGKPVDGRDVRQPFAGLLVAVEDRSDPLARQLRGGHQLAPALGDPPLEGLGVAHFRAPLDEGQVDDQIHQFVIDSALRVRRGIRAGAPAAAPCRLWHPGVLESHALEIRQVLSQVPDFPGETQHHEPSHALAVRPRSIGRRVQYPHGHAVAAVDQRRKALQPDARTLDVDGPGQRSAAPAGEALAFEAGRRQPLAPDVAVVRVIALESGQVASAAEGAAFGVHDAEVHTQELRQGLAWPGILGHVHPGMTFETLAEGKYQRLFCRPQFFQAHFGKVRHRHEVLAQRLRQPLEQHDDALAQQPGHQPLRLGFGDLVEHLDRDDQGHAVGLPARLETVLERQRHAANVQAVRVEFLARVPGVAPHDVLEAHVQQLRPRCCRGAQPPVELGRAVDTLGDTCRVELVDLLLVYEDVAAARLGLQVAHVGDQLLVVAPERRPAVEIAVHQCATDEDLARLGRVHRTVIDASARNQGQPEQGHGLVAAHLATPALPVGLGVAALDQVPGQ